MTILEWAGFETARTAACACSIVPLSMAYNEARKNPSTLRTVDGLVSIHRLFAKNNGVQNVPEALERLLLCWDDAETDAFVKDFLDIHPFADGNWRLASIVYNIRMGNGTHPIELPNYYGER